MRFKASIKNHNTFIKLAASLNLLGKVAWVRLDDEHVRFTVIPEQGSQVWAALSIVRDRRLFYTAIDLIYSQESIFEDYTIQSASPKNTINLEVPLGPLHAALKSAQHASFASIRLTKKDGVPLLSLTLQTISPLTSAGRHGGSLATTTAGGAQGDEFDDPNDALNEDVDDHHQHHGSSRDTTITQDIAVRVLAPTAVEGIHEPQCREPDVHIMLPPLLQLKSISERFTKLGVAAAAKPGSGFSSVAASRLVLAANMHGELRLGITTDALKIESRWKGLANPDLDPDIIQGGEEGIRQHPSTRMREATGDEGWATVRVDGRDWGRVLGVGRLGGRVVACFINDSALILYVYLRGEDDFSEESVLTYYIGSHVA